MCQWVGLPGRDIRGYRFRSWSYHSHPPFGCCSPDIGVVGTGYDWVTVPQATSGLQPSLQSRDGVELTAYRFSRIVKKRFTVIDYTVSRRHIIISKIDGPILFSFLVHCCQIGTELSLDCRFLKTYRQSASKLACVSILVPISDCREPTPAKHWSYPLGHTGNCNRTKER